MKNPSLIAAAGLGLAVALSAGLVVIGGCERKEGPAERAGKQVGESVGKAGKSVDDAVDTAGKKIERAGEKIQDASRDAKK
jgi:hypothetical protein